MTATPPFDWWLVGSHTFLFSFQCTLDMTWPTCILVELEGNSDEQFTVECEWVEGVAVFPIQASFWVQGLVWTTVW